MTNYSITDQLSDLQDDVDFDEWAADREAEYEEERDFRACCGDYNGPQAPGGWRDCTPAENAYYAELEAREAREAADDEARWEREAELARMRYYENRAELATLGDRYYDDPCW